MVGMDPHIAALVGLDLNDPEDVAAIAKAEAEDAAANDRQQRLDAGRALGMLLGSPEGRDQLDATGWRNEETIVVLLTADSPDHVQHRLGNRPGRVTAAVYDPTTETITFRTAEQAHLDARIRAAYHQSETGPGHDRGDFSQYLDAEPFADIDLDGPEARETVLGADDYQRLLDTLDQADRDHEQAMRARKRGGTET